MPNTIITNSMIAREAALQLDNSLVMTKLVHRVYEDEWGNLANGSKIGETLSVRKPVKYTYRSGRVAQAQDTIEGKTTITIDQEGGVDMFFSQKDRTLNINDFSERYIKPAMVTIANQVDMTVMALYKDVPNWVGTAGQTIDSISDFWVGITRMNELAVPESRSAVLSPTDYGSMVPTIPALSAVNTGTGEDALRRNKLGMIGGMDTYQAPNAPTFTRGTGAGTPLVNGASQVRTYGDASINASDYVDGVGTSTALVKDQPGTRQTLVTDGWTAGTTLKQGDIFTIADVYAVNPVSRQTLPFLRQFVVTADATATGGDATLTISPAIITSGAYQTVSVAPADDAALTMVGAASTGYRQNLFFPKPAFALCMVPIELPEAQPGASRQSYNGLSVNFTPYFDGTNFESRYRLDVLFGVKAVYPELAVRVSGTA